MKNYNQNDFCQIEVFAVKSYLNNLQLFLVMAILVINGQDKIFEDSRFNEKLQSKWFLPNGSFCSKKLFK